MKLFDKIFRDQRYDDWASSQTLLAARVLNQAAADLLVLADQDIASASWKDGLLDQSRFLLEKIAPRIREVGEPLAKMIIDEANASLQPLTPRKAIWSRSVEAAPPTISFLDGIGDVAAAVLPLGGGVATAAAVPTAAVTTTTAFFGLATTTVISWPVVLGGGALASLGLATGLLETGKIWSKVESRLRAAARKFVLGALIKGTPEFPSILEQLAAEFSTLR